MRLTNNSIRKIHDNMMEARERIPNMMIMGKSINEIHLLVSFNECILTLCDTWDSVQNRAPIYLNGHISWSTDNRPHDEQSLRDYTENIINVYKTRAPSYIQLTASRTWGILIENRS